MKKLKRILSILLSAIVTLSVITVAPITVDAATSNNWCWPTSVHSIKSDWPNYASGKYHGGTDFSVPLNSPVYSTCDGEVVAVTSLTTSYGKHIKIKASVNGSTVYMRYCHLNSFAVSVGNKVSAGQLIAYSGSTGNSTGPHLHYEVRNANDTYGSSSNPNLNPKNYLPGSSYSFATNGNNPTVSNKVEFHSSSVSNISSNAATINTWVNSSGTITKMGFSLSSNGKQFNKIYTNLSAVEWTSFYLSYDLEEYFGKLSPGQTYYYQFFIYNDGVEYTSQINTFRTNGNSYISFDTYDIPGVGEVSAKTRAWMSNSESKNISELGIICAKDMNTGNKTPVTNNVSWSRSYLDYELCEYVGKLDPGTNYYVRYYAIVDGVTYYSDYFIFTTYSKISFRDYGQSGSKVSDISTSVWIENSEAVNMDSVGFAISENGEEYFEIRVYSDKQWTTSYHEYRINDYYKLKPNKQYYVKYYVEVEDVKYYSNIIQITPIDDIVFDTYGNSTINTDTIILDVWFSNDNALNINSLGFLYGNSIYDMKKVQMFYDVTWTRAHMGQNLLNYAYFEPNSKYYCKFYATIGENTYYSNIFDFSTPINIDNTFSDPNTSTDSDTTVENPSEPTYHDKKGDINGDGTISIADATELQKHLVGLVTLSDEQLAVADTNGDGSVSVADATQIQKYITQLIPTLG